MQLKFAVALGALALLTASPASAGSVTNPQATAAVASEGTLFAQAGWNGRRRYASSDCKPYNGPYGYYGNPYCEGGFSRYGKGGGYEIDLTPYFDGRAYRSWDRRGRWR